jgi:hypothetical protein
VDGRYRRCLSGHLLNGCRERSVADAGFSSFGGIGVFEYYFGETFFDVVNAANGAARNGRRERQTSGWRVAIHRLCCMSSVHPDWYCCSVACC